MRPVVDAIMDCFLAGVALQRGFLATKDGVKIERAHLREELDSWYKNWMHFDYSRKRSRVRVLL